MTKEIITTNKQIETMEGYNEILRDIRSLFEKATYQAYKSVDNLRVQTYWQIGERIVRGELEHRDRADYGKRVIANLAKDMGLTKVVIHYMVKCYKTYPIIQTVSEQLSWSHIVELIYINDNQARQFYEIQTVQNNWSVRELREQIKTNLYQRTLKEGKLSIIQPLPLKPLLPEQVFKDTYNFDFLQLQNGYNERQLEEGLLANVQRLYSPLIKGVRGLL